MTMCEYVHVNIRKLLLTKLTQGASKKNTFNSEHYMKGRIQAILEMLTLSILLFLISGRQKLL